MKRELKNFLLFGAISCIISGCASKPAPLYFWGDYQNISSEYAKYGHDEKISEKYISEIQFIINESESRKKRVAPGIYAEYARILFENNCKEEAKKYFILEKETYPESTKFIKHVTLKLYGEEL